MNKIAIYIPNYNGEKFLCNVQIPNECTCVVMDNHSTDSSKIVCNERDFIFIENERTVSRVENWVRCIRHFEKSQFEWMKWLFTGDALEVNAGGIMMEAAKAYSEASAIIFDYSILYKGKKTLRQWSGCFKEGYINPELALRKMITECYFGTPICSMLSKRCVFDNLEFSSYVWAADIYMFYQLTQNRQIAYFSENIGDFIVENRKMYSKKRNEYFTYIEELDILRRMNTYYEECYEGEKLHIQKRVNNIMRLCLENHSLTIKELALMQWSVFRTMAKRMRSWMR